MALTADRNTSPRSGNVRTLGVAADAVIYKGAQLALNASGYLVPMSTATGLVAAGRANETVDNTGGADGAKTCQVERGVFNYSNSAAADEITIADIGATCYAVDDATVAKTDGTGTRSAAGTVFDVDSDGVWVEIGDHAAVAVDADPAGTAAALLAASLLTATDTLDFAEIAAAGSAALTITVTGAAVGDAVALGLPAAIESGLVFNGFVSAADTVTVRATNITAAPIDAASAAFTATVIKA